MDPVFDPFVSNLERSGLLGQSRLDAIRSEIAEGVHTDPEALAAALVARKSLTSWQAEKLVAGVDKGFFLGKHKLLRLIASSAMSSVFEAEHMLLHRRMALKVLHKSLNDDGSFLKRFYLEARAVAKLNHPNIIRGFDVGQEGDHHYFAMEFCEGSSLQDLCEADGPLPLEEAADVIRQASLGLQNAHEAGLVHRDIKPANLLKDLEGTIKILDLGLVRYHPDGSEDEAGLTRLHDDGVLGTIDYLSPEQAVDSHNVDIRSDIYSLGCTLYFLITGISPFGKGSLAERLLAHQSKVPPAISTLRPETPEELVRIVARMLAKRPEQRFQEPREVAAALGDWLVDRREAPLASKAEAGGQVGPRKVAGRVNNLREVTHQRSVATATVEVPDFSLTPLAPASPPAAPNPGLGHADQPIERIDEGGQVAPDLHKSWARWAHVVDSTDMKVNENGYQLIYQGLLQACHSAYQDADGPTRLVLRDIQDVVSPWPTLRSLRSILKTEMGNHILIRFHEIDQNLRDPPRGLGTGQMLVMLVVLLAGLALLFSYVSPTRDPRWLGGKPAAAVTPQRSIRARVDPPRSSIRPSPPSRSDRMDELP